MRVKGFTSLLAAAVLAALAGWTTIEPISTGLYAQAAPLKVAAERRLQARAGRCLPEPQARAADVVRRRRSSGRRPVCSRWPSILFTTKNFYKDRANWLDKRYYRCNDSRELYSCGIRAASARSRRSPRRGATATTTSARAHRQPLRLQDGEGTLRGAACPGQGEGRPDGPTKATVPDWDGYYARDDMADTGSQWIWGVAQLPTVLSVLTRNTRSAWCRRRITRPSATRRSGASFCWPEGFSRWWSQPSQAGNFQLTMTPWNVQFLSGIADNFLRQVMVGKTGHVQKVPQWWRDHRVLGRHDARDLDREHQGVAASHVMFENSEKLETVETFKPRSTPAASSSVSIRDDLLRPRRVHRAGARLLRASGDARRRSPLHSSSA